MLAPSIAASRPNHRRVLTRVSLIAAVTLSTVLGFAGEGRADTEVETQNLPGGEKRITLTQSVEPSFHIEPIVHRFEARRGTTIPFRFEIRSTGKAMNVSVMPVKLRQEITGIILHDEEGQAPSELTFSSPTEFQLAPGESTFLEGEITVPLAKSNFLSYGVLVRDNGYVTEQAGDPDDLNRITAGVRFVTQYVLRIDIETGVKDVSEMNTLAFENGQVINQQGMPVARTFLVNSTDFAFECNVRGTIESATTSRPKPFRMTLPSRTSMESDDRYLVRIMPHSKVMVAAPVDELLFPGLQSLRLEVTNGRRGLVEQAFDVNVAQGDFPALEVRQAYVDDEMSVSPAQVELGTVSGANRSHTLRFTNNSGDDKNVVAKLVDLDGQPIDDVRLSSDSFKVRGGRTKTIRLSINSGSDYESVRYGDLELAVTGQDGKPNQQRVPIAMAFGARETSNLDIGELVSVEKDGFTSFAIRVTNGGSGFVPVHANLQVADGSGSALDLADGFGRWLRPGETRELRFVPPGMLVAGQYQVALSLETTPEEEAFEKTLIIDLDPSTESSP